MTQGKKINIYFNDTKGIPKEVHDKVKDFRDEILKDSELRLTLHQVYIKLIEAGLNHKPNIALYAE